MAGRKKQKQDHQNKKNRAIELAVQGMSWSEIAKALGVDSSTVWNWRRDSGFQQQLTKLQEAIFDETALSHSTYLKNGMEALQDIALNSESEYNRLKAAVELVNLTHRNIEAIKTVEQNRKTLEGLKGDD